LFRKEKLAVIYYAPVKVDLKKMITAAEEEIKAQAQHFMNFSCGCDDGVSYSDENSLLHQFSALLNKILVPESESKKLEGFRENLNNFYEANGFPSCKTIVFRNDHLCLSFGNAEKVAFFFLDYPGKMNAPTYLYPHL